MKTWPLVCIVLAELFGTSLWFSGAAAADDLARAWSLGSVEQGWLVIAVQLGFIAGTLTFSLTGFADGFRASRVFALSSFLGAAANAAFALIARHLETALV